jgi:hypothetical protein
MRTTLLSPNSLATSIWHFSTFVPSIPDPATVPQTWNIRHVAVLLGQSFSR